MNNSLDRLSYLQKQLADSEQNLKSSLFNYRLKPDVKGNSTVIKDLERRIEKLKAKIERERHLQ